MFTELIGSSESELIVALAIAPAPRDDIDIVASPGAVLTDTAELPPPPPPPPPPPLLLVVVVVDGELANVIVDALVLSPTCTNPYGCNHVGHCMEQDVQANIKPAPQESC